MAILTVITRTDFFDKQLNRVPPGIQKKFKAWVFSVESHGILETSKYPGYHDEPLHGKRTGQRSVRMSKAYRVIYRIIKDRVHIELMEIHKHDY